MIDVRSTWMIALPVQLGNGVGYRDIGWAPSNAEMRNMGNADTLLGVRKDYQMSEAWSKRGLQELVHAR